MFEWISSPEALEKLVGEVRDRLRALYAQPLDADEMRRRKRDTLAPLAESVRCSAAVSFTVEDATTSTRAPPISGR